MTLRMRKLVVLGIIAAVLLTANALVVATWLDDAGVIALASSFCTEFLPGSAIAVITALLILLVSPERTLVIGRFAARRCPVCDHVLARRGRYCAECGGRV
jgi:hypothetical protein